MDLIALLMMYAHVMLMDYAHVELVIQEKNVINVRQVIMILMEMTWMIVLAVQVNSSSMHTNFHIGS